METNNEKVKFDFSRIPKKCPEILENIKNIIITTIEEYSEYPLDEEEWENIFSRAVIRKAKAYMIIANNNFDLNEANNYIYTANVKILQEVCFTGGSYFTSYEIEDTTKPSYIIQGNLEEGYNIFELIA